MNKYLAFFLRLISSLALIAIGWSVGVVLLPIAILLYILSRFVTVAGHLFSKVGSFICGFVMLWVSYVYFFKNGVDLKSYLFVLVECAAGLLVFQFSAYIGPLFKLFAGLVKDISIFFFCMFIFPWRIGIRYVQIIG